jgi:hypothetical protein
VIQVNNKNHVRPTSCWITLDQALTPKTVGILSVVFQVCLFTLLINL